MAVGMGTVFSFLTILILPRPYVALYCLVNTDKHGAEEANEGLDQGHVAAITAAIAKFENDKLNNSLEIILRFL